MTQPARSKEAGKNLIADPETRKKFKSSLATLTHYFQQIDDHKEGLKESVAAVAAEYNLDKKIVRKMATTMYKHDYASRLEEERHFQVLYEMIVEGQLRDDDDNSLRDDPLDRDSDAE